MREGEASSEPVSMPERTVTRPPVETPRPERRDHFALAWLLRLRVAAAFFAEAERCSGDRAAEAAPPLLPPISPPFLLETLVSGLPRPLPDLLPPPVSLFTVAHARRSASYLGDPAILVTLGDVLGLTLLLVGIFGLVAPGHGFPLVDSDDGTCNESSGADIIVQQMSCQVRDRIGLQFSFRLRFEEFVRRRARSASGSLVRR